MRGRKPKPTVLKDLHGSDQPANPNEPVPIGNLVDNPTDYPEYFNTDQRDAWEYAVRHSPPGMLKRIDAGVLETWVVAHCLHRKATQAQNRAGLLFRQGTSDFPVQSPYIPIINRQALIMLRAASELGFSPVSRPRIFAGGMPASGGEGLSRPANGRDAPQESIESYLANAPRATSVH